MLGCNQQFVKIDGQVDAMEESLIRLGADSAMAADPAIVPDVHQISGQMLTGMDAGAYSDDLIMADIIREEAIRADLMPAQAETLVVFALMMKSAIIAKVGEDKASVVLDNGVIVYKIIEIINDQARLRLEANQKG
jgi:hypothetical protein